jgi:hypothetical protein
VKKKRLKRFPTAGACPRLLSHQPHTQQHNLSSTQKKTAPFKITFYIHKHCALSSPQAGNNKN